MQLLRGVLVSTQQYAQWLQTDLPLATPELDHDALRFNLLLPAQQKSRTKVTLLLLMQQNNPRWRLLSFSWYSELPAFPRFLQSLSRSPSCTLLYFFLPHFLSCQFMSARLCVVQIPPSVVRSEVYYGWVFHPHPLINSWGASPPTNLTGNPFQYQRAALVCEQVETSTILARWKLTQPFQVPSTTSH